MLTRSRTNSSIASRCVSRYLRSVGVAFVADFAGVSMADISTPMGERLLQYGQRFERDVADDGMTVGPLLRRRCLLLADRADLARTACMEYAAGRRIGCGRHRA